jgi:hypothetical protein
MRGKSAALLSQGRVSPWWIRQPQEATTMAKAQRARAAMIASYPKVFHSVIEVDEHTAVPKDAACAPADLANEFDLEGRLVVCVGANGVRPVASVPDARRLCPYYDVDRRELWLGEFVLKRFEKPAENQEAIPIAFEDAAKKNGGRWPVKVLDPISGICVSRVKRLHDALDPLNAAILEGAVEAAAPYCLEFRSDGTGRGIRWEIATVAGLVNGEYRRPRAGTGLQAQASQPHAGSRRKSAGNTTTVRQHGSVTRHIRTTGTLRCAARLCEPANLWRRRVPAPRAVI